MSAAADGRPHGRRLVLLRHGRTAWNASGRVQGQADVDLDDVGRAQAARTAPALADLHPTLLWSSDLARTRQTAEPLAAVTGLTVRHDPRLREFSFGDREGLSRDEYAERHPEEHAALRAGDYDAIESAESSGVVAERMTAALTDLRAALDDGQVGVAVSHGGAIRVAVGVLLGWPADQFHTLRGLGNCGWVVLDEHPADSVLRLTAYGRQVAPGPSDPDFTA